MAAKGGNHLDGAAYESCGYVAGGFPVGRMLLYGVREEDLQRERLQLAQVRLTQSHVYGLSEAQDAWAWQMQEQL